jgi:syntaxin 16
MKAKFLGYHRDRTSFFVQAREETHRSVVHGGVDSDLLPTEPAASPLIQQASGIEGKFQELEMKIGELKDLQDRRIAALSSFDETPDLESAVEASTKAIAKLITALGGMIKTEVKSQGYRAELEKAMQQGHAARLRDISLGFREMQSGYIKRIREAESRGGHGRSEDLAASGQFIIDDFDTTFTGPQQAQVMEHDLYLQELNGQIMAILRQVEEISQMFTDLAQLILEQGTMLDRIDHSLRLAVEDMEHGNEDLNKAEQHQKTGSKCFIVYIILMVVLILILGSVILIRKGKQSGGGDSGDNGGGGKATPTPFHF